MKRELAVVDGAIFQESNRPVALPVAPIRREQLFPPFLHRLDAFDLECTFAVALNKVERLGVLGQWLEVERNVALPLLVCLYIRVKFYAVR